MQLSKLGPDAACAGILKEGDVFAVDGWVRTTGRSCCRAPSVRVGMRHCVQRVPIGSRKTRSCEMVSA